jgi:hypothetical protein
LNFWFENKPSGKPGSLPSNLKLPTLALDALVTCWLPGMKFPIWVCTYPCSVM